MKEILYDWLGVNTSIFQFINSNFGRDELDPLMIFGDVVGGHHYAHYHITFLFMFALYSIYKKRTNNVVFKDTVLYWADLIATLPIALVLSTWVIFTLKGVFAFSRPYCTAGLENIHIIPYIIDQTNCYTSFPSGHFAFSTTFLASLWPALNTRFKYLLSFALLFVGISRMAAGAHFPADLTLSFLICVPLVIATRRTLHWLTKKFHKTLVKHVPAWDEITTKIGFENEHLRG